MAYIIIGKNFSRLISGAGVSDIITLYDKNNK
jgi:hypothetical protein